jgi:hypothetical protein
MQRRAFIQFLTVAPIAAADAALGSIATVAVPSAQKVPLIAAAHPHRGFVSANEVRRLEGLDPLRDRVNVGEG